MVRCAVALTVALSAALLSASGVPSAAATGRLASAFATAAQRYGVPMRLLIAISYAETRWDPAPAGGPMALSEAPNHAGTLHQAAAALHVPIATLSDPATSIRGAAAVLAGDQRSGGAVPDPGDVDRWYGTVAAYSGLSLDEPATEFADTVFRLLRSGVDGTAATGEHLHIDGGPARADPRQLDRLRLTHVAPQRSDYPRTDAVIPAGPGAFEPARRPEDGVSIRYIVIHDTETDYPGTVRTFSDPSACCAANFVVDGEPGTAYPGVTQMVPVGDVAYHAGNLWYNQHSVGIEHIGYADHPATFYTPTMYERSARLAGYLAAVHGIPVDRAHILGHGNVPAPFQSAVHDMHWDPGPFWDWGHYLRRVREFEAAWQAGSASARRAVASEVDHRVTPRIRTIRPHGGHLGDHRSFTEVHQQPGGPALVLGASDPSSWTSAATFDAADFACDNVPGPGRDGGPDRNADLRARAELGEAFALLARQRAADGTVWDAVDFNGVTGYIRDEDTQDGDGTIVTFRGGGVPTTIHGRPDPDSSFAICGGPPGSSPRRGQSYVAQDAWVDGRGTAWYEISYNHRVAWVPAPEVAVQAVAAGCRHSREPSAAELRPESDQPDDAAAMAGPADACGW
jgi:N-acetyl-anhydromuramyl-L-alanine amidase AmpD